MRRKKMQQMAQGMDREYGSAQLWMLYQLPRFSAQGGRPSGREAETLKRVLLRIVAWGVSHDDLEQRAWDHTFWMFVCEKHGEEVLGWDAELSNLSTEEERLAATARFRERYSGEFAIWIEEEQRRDEGTDSKPKVQRGSDKEAEAIAYERFAAHLRSCRVCATEDGNWVDPDSMCEEGRQLYDEWVAEMERLD
jgi:hypothetical protein